MNISPDNKSIYKHKNIDLSINSKCKSPGPGNYKIDSIFNRSMDMQNYNSISFNKSKRFIGNKNKYQNTGNYSPN